MNPRPEYRVMWNDYAECWESLPGQWSGDVFRGSFVTYVCDEPIGHDGPHVDSCHLFAWYSEHTATLASV